MGNVTNKNGSKDLINTARSNEIRGVFEKNKKGNKVLSGLVIGKKEILFSGALTRETHDVLEYSMKSLGLGGNISSAIIFLVDIASSYQSLSMENSFDYVVSFLQEMKPEDPIEARLLVQHLLLSETGYSLLRQGMSNEMLYQAEFYLKNATKLMSLSQQAVQALTKYKTKGRQQINILHMDGGAKAIVTNEMGGVMAQNQRTPHNL